MSIRSIAASTLATGAAVTGLAFTPDLLGRDFTVEAPNQRYVGDITYLPLHGVGTCTWRR